MIRIRHLMVPTLTTEPRITVRGVAGQPRLLGGQRRPNNPQRTGYAKQNQTITSRNTNRGIRSEEAIEKKENK